MFFFFVYFYYLFFFFFFFSSRRRHTRLVSDWSSDVCSSDLISVGQPEIADVNLLGQNHILVTGKKAGTTQLVVWDDGEKAQVMDVAVQVDVNGLQEQIKKFFPTVKVDVAASNGEVVLRGTVPSLEIEEQIARIAASYAARVNDFMVISGGQQVMLQVRFAEVSRAA